MFIKTKETDKDEQGLDSLVEQNLINLMKEMSLIDTNTYNLKEFKPTEFEKDDDSNFHIEFMNSASNLRALVYRIEGVS